MKKFSSVFLALILFLSSCGLGNPSTDVSEIMSTQESVMAKTTETMQLDASKMEYFISTARNLYEHYLAVSFDQGLVQDFQLRGVVIEKVYDVESGFEFLAYYDVLSNTDFNPGSGEEQEDGWIREKYAYIVMRDKGFGAYEIESITPEKIDRSKE